MDEVRLKNFRCFRDEQTARLAPLTLLVGENSTGKTSFLALVRVLWDAAYGYSVPDFKESPYDLGSFDEIAHYRGGRAGRASVFSFAFRAAFGSARRRSRKTKAPGESHHFEVTFGRRGVAAVPIESTFRNADAAITHAVTADTSRKVLFKTGKGEWQWQMTGRTARQFEAGALVPRDVIYPALVGGQELQPVADSPALTEEEGNRLKELWFDFSAAPFGQRPFASAPVRSKPRRTYDPSRPTRNPEGDTIPMYLSTAFFEDKKSWQEMKSALEAFGKEAGLFDEIAVKPLGKRGSEPFQVHVRRFGRRSKGPLRNLIDVGYGVSQVLPVITELFRDDTTPMFLLQQPEVHLHPSAQAALGSLFCEIAAPWRQLVVETHSDHLLDRVRMDVRDGKAKLNPDDVSILFFEPGDLDVRIHSLRLDEEGNVLGAPPSYRRFFMDETRRSLRL